MASALYDKGRNRFARGDISWKATGGDVIRAFILDAAEYTPDLAADEFLDDVPAAARKGNSGATGRTDAAALTLIDPVAGVCDAADTTLTNVSAGAAHEYILIFKDDESAEATSPLIALIDTATGLPVTPSGGDIIITWDSGANKIFKL